MRFIVLSKATSETEAGTPPTVEEMVAMGRYMEEMNKAGVLIAADGLQPTSKGALVRFEGDDRTVVDGPFAETKEVIASYTILDVASKEEAIEWVKRFPSTSDGEVEIRQIFEPEDFADVATPEVAAFDDKVGVLRKEK